MGKIRCMKCLLIMLPLILSLYHFPFTSRAEENYFAPTQPAKIVSAVEQTLPSLNVKVLDARTYQPLHNATVVLWDLYDLKNYIYFTDENGECKIFRDNIKPRRSYWLYAYRGNFEKKIIDYVPAKVEISFEGVEGKNLTLLLFPGALIEVEGVPYLAQSPDLKIYRTIIRVVVETKTFNYSFIAEYGSSLDAYFLSLPSDIVIVPANVPFSLEVEVPYLQREYMRVLIKDEIFRIDNQSLPFVMPQGSRLRDPIKLPAYSLKRGIEYTKSVFADVSRLVDEAQAVGFMVFDEKRILGQSISQIIIKAEMLLQRAQKDEDFKEVWLTLRKALDGIDSIRNILRDKLLFAESQAIYLPAVISVFSIVISSFFFEDNRMKAISNLIFYALFLIVLYYTHPGTHVIIGKNFILFICAAVLSFTTFSALIFILPRVWKERTVEGEVSWRSAITIIFSMGKRQIKRKKIRGFFTIFSIGILVLAFTSLTSIGTVFGVVSERVNYTPSSDGIIVRRIINGSSALFSPLGYGDIITVSEMIPATDIAQRWKSFPRADPIARLENPKTNSYHLIYGIIAISPKNESVYTNLDSIITGEYLSDDSYGEVLISLSVANRLGIRENDNVILKIPDAKMEEILVVKGLINDEEYDALRDIDGSFFGPYRLLGGDDALRICNSTEVIIVNLKTAEKIREKAPNLILPSEIIFRPSNIADLESKIKNLVYTYGYDILVSLNGVITHYHIGRYIEFKGVAELLIPMIMVILNVSMVMVNSAYERGKEIRVLSMLGLNPTHIGLTFVAEAVVMGMVGGSLGYLAGLSFYRVMILFGRDLMVREKLEWWWSAIGFTLAILVSVLSAMRPAAMAVSAYTPSKVKKVKRPREEIMKRKEEIFKVYQAREVTMPVKVLVSEKEFFLSFFLDHLYDLRTGYTERVSNIEDIPEIESVKGELIKTIKFSYHFGPPERMMGTKNTLILIKSPSEEYYRIKLSAEPSSPGMPESAIDRTIDFVHEILMEWVKNKKRIMGAV